MVRDQQPAFKRENRPNARQRGYNYRWEKARARFLAANPLCSMCKEQAHVTAATVVDHIIPHKGDPVLFWDERNWQALCTTHHSRDKQRIERGRPMIAIGPDGWPI